MVDEDCGYRWFNSDNSSWFCEHDYNKNYRCNDELCPDNSPTAIIRINYSNKYHVFWTSDSICWFESLGIKWIVGHKFGMPGVIKPKKVSTIDSITTKSEDIDLIDFMVNIPKYKSKKEDDDKW